MTGQSRSRLEKICIQFTIFLAVCAAVSAYLTLYVPLADVPMIKKFIDLILRLTCLSNMGLESSHKDAARAYYIFTVPMIFGIFGWYWMWAKRRDGREATGLLLKSRESLRWYHKLYMIVLIPLWIAILIGGWMGFSGGNSRLFAIGSSIHVLALLGWVFPGAAAALIFLTIGSIKKVFTGKI